MIYKNLCYNNFLLFCSHLSSFPETLHIKMLQCNIKNLQKFTDSLSRRYLIFHLRIFYGDMSMINSFDIAHMKIFQILFLHRQKSNHKIE
jgi:hypothetical protein